MREKENKYDNIQTHQQNLLYVLSVIHGFNFFASQFLAHTVDSP